ncbi:acetyltransferase [Gordoniibacillus kamchatkensis]|uniref:Acetyltransferase n=1 Tax=Gordoniibacillus kamchatkensis TaxID=1590651 RepID=A0ABR5AB82_9BACL|nr:N-acetyltransferase [Paenibacillus sp. VKM B-2647]KIL38278.1 acetyltransferase [Paenibacillus sp. VKM B-2647]
MKTGTVACRKATERDLDTLYRIIQGYAEQGIMLPRSREMLQEQIETFVVAEIDDELVGCGALTRLGPDLVEIRSLGVTDGHKGQGIGNKLIAALVEEAARLGIAKVMALTYEVSFFQRNGFTIVPKDVFPEKVWKDCMNCKKRFACDEIAVLRRLEAKPEV